MGKDIIKKLKDNGFFELVPLAQIEYLRRNNFFEMDINERIEFLERIGLFYIDVNEDPPTKPLKPDDKDLDYLKEQPINATKNRVANDWKYHFVKNAMASGQLQIDGTEGIERVLEIPTGAIITCNHFHPFDSFSIEQALLDSGNEKKLYKVSREGNFTNFFEEEKTPKRDSKGNLNFNYILSLYFKFDNLLPLSQEPETMRLFDKSIGAILKRGDLVLVCPEQSMWMGYKKPKPMKYGAFKWATVNDVPVVPSFITQREVKDNPGAQAYTIHFGEPIYPDHNLPVRENIKRMRDLDYKFCKETYERVYGIPLQYETEMHADIPQYIKDTPDFDKMAKTKEQKDVDDTVDYNL